MGTKATFVSHTENFCISLGDAAVFSVPVVRLHLCQIEKFEVVFNTWERTSLKLEIGRKSNLQL